MRRLCAVLFATFVLVLTGAHPAWAVPPVDIVHSETIELGGDSIMTVSFSQWPLQERRSLDILFEPEGGIEGRTATLRAIGPDGEPAGTLGQVGGVETGEGGILLPRHPRDRSVWGLDVVSLPEEGTWRFEFTVRGPDGTSAGSLPIVVGPQPGPPYALSWTVAMLPWIVSVPVLAYGWIRSRPIRVADTRAWSG